MVTGRIEIVWSVLMRGVWEPAEDDDVVLDWIARGWIGPDSLLRHATWAEPQRLDFIQSFRDAIGPASVRYPAGPPPRGSDGSFEPASVRHTPLPPPPRGSHGSFAPAAVRYTAPPPPPRAPHDSLEERQTRYLLQDRPKGNHPAGDTAIRLVAGAWLCLGPFLSIPAIVMASRALREVRRDPERYDGPGPARAALVLAWLNVDAWLLIGTVRALGRVRNVEQGLCVGGALVCVAALVIAMLPRFAKTKETLEPWVVFGLGATFALAGLVRWSEVAALAERARAATQLCVDLSGAAMKPDGGRKRSVGAIQASFDDAEGACIRANNPARASAVAMAKRMRLARAYAEIDREREAAAAAEAAAAEEAILSESVVPLTAVKLLADYKKGEGFGNEAHRDTRVRITGKFGALFPGTTDETRMTVGTGAPAEKEEAMVQCFLLPRAVAGAKALSKGKAVTVDGTVEGLGMGGRVILRACVLR